MPRMNFYIDFYGHTCILEFIQWKIEKLAKDTKHVLAKHQPNIYKLSCIVDLTTPWHLWCILSSSDMISVVLFKVIFQIYLKIWNLYNKTDTSLRRTLHYSPIEILYWFLPLKTDTLVFFDFFARKIEKLAKDTQHVLAKHQPNYIEAELYVHLTNPWYLWCILCSSDMISMVLFKVIFQIYLKRWNLYKTDTSLRRTLGHSPKVSVLRGSTVLPFVR